jgi:hypothetical protein
MIDDKPTSLDTLCTCEHRRDAHYPFMSHGKIASETCLFVDCGCTNFRARNDTMTAQESEVKRLTIEWAKSRGAKR